MIIKRRDSKQTAIDELTDLLSRPLPANKKFQIERELRFLSSGEQGEKDAAYYIDFHAGKSRRWVVIHDLRLEFRDRVAQIDHLMINRLFDIYILESKNFSHGVKISDTGEFLAWSGARYHGVESPIEQNKRHQIVLEEVIKEYNLMPTRLGMTIPPSFYSYILVSPKSQIIRPAKGRFDTSMVIGADKIRTSIEENANSTGTLTAIGGLSKMSSIESVIEMSKRLAALHKPFKIDYRKKFGLEESPSKANIEEKVETATPKQFYCFQCKRTITEKVAKFCWDNRQRFGGKAFCFDCQKMVAK